MTEVVTFATAVVVLLTGAVALVATVLAWRTRKEVEQVHVLVNSAMSDMVERVNQLAAALDQSGTAVPPAHERESQEER